MADDNLADDDGAPHLTTTEARAGATPHVVRYVLAASLGLVVVVFIAAWAVMNPSRHAAGDATSSVVAESAAVAQSRDSGQ